MSGELIYTAVFISSVSLMLGIRSKAHNKSLKIVSFRRSVVSGHSSMAQRWTDFFFLLNVAEDVTCRYLYPLEYGSQTFWVRNTSNPVSDTCSFGAPSSRCYSPTCSQDNIDPALFSVLNAFLSSESHL